MLDLPKEYKILPKSIDFIIPGFERFSALGNKTLALRQRNCCEWYNEFADRLIDSCGCLFLPVCRMSDGEFKFILGNQPPDIRLPLIQRFKHLFIEMFKNLRNNGRFEAKTSPNVYSGAYTAKEWRKACNQYGQMVKKISRKGILALHLSYGDIPFQECYFPGFNQWIGENQIVLTDDNYYPFYFVYALLTGKKRVKLLKNRRVLVVNGAVGEKQQKIKDGLKREGVSDVLWCPISLDRSLYDSINVNPFMDKVDLVLVGAGIGKPNILIQLERLQVPCIDAGYVFEIWADPRNKWKRPVCATDDEFALYLREIG